jgi:hypothetical protein
VKKFMRWDSRPKRSFQLIVGQAHRVQERIPPRVLSEIHEERVPPHAGQAAVALPTRAFEPFESSIFIRAIRVGFGNLIGCRFSEALG